MLGFCAQYVPIAIQISNTQLKNPSKIINFQKNAKVYTINFLRKLSMSYHLERAKFTFNNFHQGSEKSRGIRSADACEATELRRTP